MSTYWDEENGKDTYRLVIHLDRRRTIEALSITGYEHQNFAPKDFEIRFGNQVVKKVTDATYNKNVLRVDLSPVKVRKVELRIKGYYGDSPAIRELKLLSPNKPLAAMEMDPSLAEPVDPEDLTWERSSGASIKLTGPEGTIWQYHYGDQFGKPHFDPMGPYNKPSLTWSMPPDHVWHYGMWFSWKTLNGVNYWEEDEETHKGKGRTSWSDVRVTRHEDGSARITMKLAYHRPSQDPVLTERRTLRIGPPRTDGSYMIDWQSEFATQEEAVKLDRTPLPGEQGGKPWGGYAGLSIRYAKELKQHRVTTTSAGALTLKNGKARPRARAADLSGKINGQPMGISIIDHPSNPRSPSPWYAISKGDMGFLNAALIQHQPMTLESNQTMQLRYRVFVHTERWDAKRLRMEAERYRRHRASREEKIAKRPIQVRDQALVYRVLLPDASTRSMAVGLPNGPSICFDAERCVMQYGWRGGFIDHGPQIDERGGDIVKLLGNRFSVGNPRVPFKLAEGGEGSPEVTYGQHRIKNDRVVFRYDVEGMSVHQTVTPTPDGLGLISRYRLGEVPESDLLLRRDRDTVHIRPSERSWNKLSQSGWSAWFPQPSPVYMRVSEGSWNENTLRIASEDARSFSLTIRPRW